MSPVGDGRPPIVMPSDRRTPVRSLIVNAFVTLDGVMQAPGGPEEDPTGGFSLGGWSVNYWDDTMNAAMAKDLDQPFDLLLGRRTYEIFAAHWPYAGDAERAERGGDASDIEDPAGEALNSARKYVASRTLDTVTWNNSRLLEGDVGDAVASLKAQDGPPIFVHGSSDLIQTLLADGLVDELRVWIFPVVVGPGKRLFGEGTQASGLRLVDVTTSTTGVVIATYRPAGPIERGSFAFDDPTPEETARRSRLAAEDRA
jgi:dihydrofolate reductase